MALRSSDVILPEKVAFRQVKLRRSFERSPLFQMRNCIRLTLVFTLRYCSADRTIVKVQEFKRFRRMIRILRSLSGPAILSLLLMSSPSQLQGANASSKPAHLTCDSLVEPLGIDTEQPLFSWQLQDTAFGAHQTAYRLRIATSPAYLEVRKARCVGQRRGQVRPVRRREVCRRPAQATAALLLAGRVVGQGRKGISSQRRHLVGNRADEFRMDSEVDRLRSRGASPHSRVRRQVDHQCGRRKLQRQRRNAPRLSLELQRRQRPSSMQRSTSPEKIRSQPG